MGTRYKVQDAFTLKYISKLHRGQLAETLRMRTLRSVRPIPKVISWPKVSKSNSSLFYIYVKGLLGNDI